MHHKAGIEIETVVDGYLSSEGTKAHAHEIKIRSIINETSNTTDLMEAIQTYNNLIEKSFYLKNLSKDLLFSLEKHQDQNVIDIIQSLKNDSLIASYVESTIEDLNFFCPERIEEFICDIMPEILTVLDLENEKAFEKIKKLLESGLNVNQAETICAIVSKNKLRSSILYLQSDRHKLTTIYTREIYPLHFARGKKITKLLLEQGADLNLQGYFLTVGYRGKLKYQLPYREEDDNLTPLEAKLKQYDIDCDKWCRYDNAKEWTRPLFNLELETIQELASWTSGDVLLRLYVTKLQEMNRLHTWIDTHEKSTIVITGIIQNQKKRYKLAQHLVDTLQDALIQKSLLSMWLVLRAGYAQNNNFFSSLPMELLQLIMLVLSHTNTREQSAEKMLAQCEVLTFKNILSIIGEDASAIFKLNYSIEFGSISTDKLALFLESIKPQHLKNNLENKDAKVGALEVSNLENLIVDAWRLAKMCSGNFTSQNKELVDGLRSFIVKKNQAYQWLDNYIYSIKFFDGKSLFDSAKEKHLLSINEKIMKQIDDLTKPKMTVENERPRTYRGCSR